MKLVGLLFCASALSLLVGAAEEATTLDELLASRAAHPEIALPMHPLKVAWVGDVIDDDGTVTKLRLDHGGLPVPNTGPVLVRMRGDSYLGSEAPSYLEHLPEPDDLRKIKSLKDLNSLLGDPGLFIDVLEEDGRICWNPMWPRFTRETTDRLIYLQVSASVSRAAGEKNDAPARVDQITLSKGILRPTDPSSATELEEYPSGEALFLAEQEALKQERAKLPELLRDLVAVRDQPDDPDLVHWRAYLNGVRAAPDPKLFQQLIQELGDGTCSMKMDFESVMVDGWLKLEPWKPGQRAVAVEACINAIPTAKNDSIVEDVIITLLKMKGGGSIEVQSLDGKSGCTIKVSGSGYSLGGAKNPLPFPEVQRRLRALLLEENSTGAK